MKRQKPPYDPSKILLVLSILLTFSGCAPIDVVNLIPISDQENNLVTEGPLYKSITVNKVGGAKDKLDPSYPTLLNSDLKSAIIQSLKNNNHYAPEDVATISLDVFLIEIEATGRGFEPKITTFIRYKITNKKSGEIVYNEILSDTKTDFSAMSGYLKLRIAIEKATKGNIEKFLKSLHLLNKEI